MPGLAGGLWRLAATLAAPGLRVMLRRRAARGKEIAGRLAEREGIDDTARPGGPLVWVHAASVGESVSVLPVLELLTGVTVLMTTGTVTAARMLAERAPGVLHRFVPLDVPAWGDRFLDHWRPDVAVFVESELWPNLLAGCRARGVPTMVVNGRMSERSFRGWRRAAGFARAVMGGVALVHPQAEADGARFRALGATRLMPAGNLKLAAEALPVDAGELARLQGVLAAGPVWLAASTHPGEEAVAAGVHRALVGAWPGLVTIIAPRHPERGVELAQALGARRRGAGEDPAAGAVWVADTLGELGLLYRLSPVAFVGGSLVPLGGQNPLEAARLGCAVAMGPEVANAVESVRRLVEAEALVTVADEGELAAFVERMLGDARARTAMGARAAGVADGEAALPGRVAGAILDLVRGR